MNNARRTTIIGAFLLAFIIALLPRLSAAAPAPGDTRAASADARRDQVPRFFAARLNIYARDDDWPDPDDNENKFYGPFEKVLDDNNKELTFQIPPLEWGGECRVEVDEIKAVLQPDGTVAFQAFARLWEGTDTGRTNLRDAKVLHVTVPRKTSDFRYQERLAWEGGDFADIKWSFDNVINE